MYGRLYVRGYGVSGGDNSDMKGGIELISFVVTSKVCFELFLLYKGYLYILFIITACFL